ncbi:hypothetical protein HYFRA_00005015 [Hymenoscyphus fraxineus]|uniref:N-acetyltransferase domain-containing protein n=1 Tax=Hymenoscyphus fraxineus TaxID=746836 RepID=A0A9N9PPF3_9HELO|nr:hypothetical protein HYFRA_00005015 [Hymenoscyphus fraxineus]
MPSPRSLEPDRAKEFEEVFNQYAQEESPEEAKGSFHAHVLGKVLEDGKDRSLSTSQWAKPPTPKRRTLLVNRNNVKENDRPTTHRTPHPDGWVPPHMRQLNDVPSNTEAGTSSTQCEPMAKMEQGTGTAVESASQEKVIPSSNWASVAPVKVPTTVVEAKAGAIVRANDGARRNASKYLPAWLRGPGIEGAEDDSDSDSSSNDSSCEEENAGVLLCKSPEPPVVVNSSECHNEGIKKISGSNQTGKMASSLKHPIAEPNINASAHLPAPEDAATTLNTPAKQSSAGISPSKMGQEQSRLLSERQEYKRELQKNGESSSTIPEVAVRHPLTAATSTQAGNQTHTAANSQISTGQRPVVQPQVQGDRGEQAKVAKPPHLQAAPVKQNEAATPVKPVKPFKPVQPAQPAKAAEPSCPRDASVEQAHVATTPSHPKVEPVEQATTAKPSVQDQWGAGQLKLATAEEIIQAKAKLPIFQGGRYGHHTSKQAMDKTPVKARTSVWKQVKQEALADASLSKLITNTVHEQVEVKPMLPLSQLIAKNGLPPPADEIAVPPAGCFEVAQFDELGDFENPDLPDPSGPGGYREGYREGVRARQGDPPEDELGDWSGGFQPPPCDWANRAQETARMDYSWVPDHIDEWRQYTPSGPEVAIDVNEYAEEFKVGMSIDAINTCFLPTIHIRDTRPDHDNCENEERRLFTAEQNITRETKLMASRPKAPQVPIWRLLAGRDDAAMRAVEEERMANYVSPPNPNRPRMDMYLRPATVEDAAEIARIYNYYVVKTHIPEDQTPISVTDAAFLIEDAKKQELPFIVAIKGKLPSFGVDVLGRPTKPRKSMLPACEIVLGCIWVEAYNFGILGQRNGRSRRTATLQLYVDPQFTRKKVGFSLLDRMLFTLHPRYGFEDQHAWVNVDGDKMYIHEGYDKPNFHQIVFQLPVLSRNDPNLEGVTEFLKNKFWILEAARMHMFGRTHALNGELISWLDLVIFTGIVWQAESFGQIY